MADLTVTAANVARVTASSKVYQGVAGATITAGQVVYQDSATQKFLLAQADTVTKANVFGIALHGAANNQPLTVLIEGDYNPGATVVVGMVYAVSDAAAGGIAPYGDLLSGDFVSVVGVGITASLLRVNFQVSGIAKPA